MPARVQRPGSGGSYRGSTAAPAAVAAVDVDAWAGPALRLALKHGAVGGVPADLGALVDERREPAGKCP